MPALARFESFMENMVEGSVARLFRSPVQPAEIAKRLERAMETQQTISVRRVIVPNAYRAFLNPQDLAAFTVRRQAVSFADRVDCPVYVFFRFGVRCIDR